METTLDVKQLSVLKDAIQNSTPCHFCTQCTIPCPQRGKCDQGCSRNLVYRAVRKMILKATEVRIER